MKFKLNKETAELAGVIAGDGYLHKFTNRIIIKGSIDDYYYINYLMPSFIKNFNIKPILYKQKNKNSYFLQIENKNVFSFFVKELGMKRGAKHLKVLIPMKIMLNNAFSKSFVRGLFDTDGGLKFSKQNKKFNYYPRIRICAKKSPMTKQIKIILDRLRFNYSKYLDKRREGDINNYEISGFNNLNKWLKLIGMSNPVNISKVLFIKKKGFYEPNLSLLERLKILKYSVEGLSSS